MVRHHALTDEQWVKIESFLDRGRPGPKAKIGDRQFIDVVIYRAKTDIPWRDVPERFGPWKSGYNRFNNWAKVGSWDLLVAVRAIELDGVDEEEDSIVDVTIVRAHQDAAGGKGGSNGANASNSDMKQLC